MGTATIYELRSREGARVGKGRADAGARHNPHAPAGLEKRRPSMGGRSDRPVRRPRRDGGGLEGEGVPDRGAEGVGAGGWAESGEGGVMTSLSIQAEATYGAVIHASCSIAVDQIIVFPIDVLSVFVGL